MAEPPRIGSLFSGYGGLDMAVEQVTGGRVVWVSDIDKGACKILAHRYPDVPNLGDISTVNWSTVEPIEVLCGGFPCQDVSHAGKRVGLRPDSRSGLWTQMAYAIDQLRPRLVVAENVRGLLSAEAHSNVERCPWCLGDDPDESALRALGAVLGDLADVGYDADWTSVRASDVGAPHGRFRVFVVAYPAGDPWRISNGDGLPTAVADGLGGERSGRAWGRRPGLADDGSDAPDTDREQSELRQGSEWNGRPELGGSDRTAADAAGDGRDEGRPESARLVGRPDAAERSDAPTADAGGIG